MSGLLIGEVLDLVPGLLVDAVLLELGIRELGEAVVKEVEFDSLLIEGEVQRLKVESRRFSRIRRLDVERDVDTARWRVRVAGHVVATNERDSRGERRQEEQERERDLRRHARSMYIHTHTE